MKKTLLLLSILLFSVFLNGCTTAVDQSQPEKSSPVDEQKEELEVEKEISNLVESFGSKLQKVPLLASEDLLRKSMEENYGDYVSEELIEKWVKDPLNAPGRQVSSPWPDRIEIISIAKLTDNSYEVKGEIIEITSVEKKNGGFAAKHPITLKVEKFCCGWIITDVTLGDYE